MRWCWRWYWGEQQQPNGTKPFSQLLEGKERVKDRKVRLSGVLVRGTLVRRDQPCEYRFRITEGGKEVEVRYPHCVVPDTFRDVPGVDVNVSATGRITHRSEDTSRPSKSWPNAPRSTRGGPRRVPPTRVAFP